MLYCMLFVGDAWHEEAGLAGTIATAAAELLCCKIAHIAGLTAKLNSAAIDFDQPWLISGPMPSMLELHLPEFHRAVDFMSASGR
jgi:hypothetical protein